MSVTETITNPDSSVTTISSTDLEMEETIPEGKALGSLSTGQLDLSKIASDDNPGADDFQGSVEESMRSNCLLDLGTDFLVGNMVFI